MGNSGWRRAGAWVASGGIAAGGLGGCQPASPGSAEVPVRSDVTDIRPMPRTPVAATTTTAYEPPLYDTSGPIPTLPEAVAEPTAAAATATVVPSDVMFTSTASSPPSVAARARTHVVRRGETWFAIARAQYGDGAQWHRLAAANPDAAHGPLRIGQQLVVP